MKQVAVLHSVSRPCWFHLLATAIVLLVCCCTSTAAEEERALQRRRSQPYSFSPDIVEIADSDDRFDTLVAALSIAGLTDVLRCNTWRYWRCTDFTVFAPTDAAFSDATVTSVVDKYTTDSNYLTHLQELLLYHVVAGEVMSSEIEDRGYIETVQGEDLYTLISNGDVLIDSAEVVQADIDAKNGIIHAVNALLLPFFVTNDIVSVASDAGSFTSLIQAASDTGVASELVALDPLTVFAPTDDAFTEAADIIAELTTDEIAEVLRYHMISGAVVPSSEVSTGTVTTYQGEELDIRVRRNAGTITFNSESSSVISADILASNGIIHAIDQVLLPPSIAARFLPTIADIVASSDDFTTLEAALESVNLTDTFNSTASSYTVFAPTDDAFSALGDDVVSDLLGTSDLSNILQYHVLDSVVTSDALTSGPVIALNGGIIGVSFKEGGAFLNRNVQITAVDIVASNGIVHVIDAVLLPKTVVEVAEERGLTELVAAIDSVPGIREALSDTSGTSYVTLFGPNNKAFERLGDISGLSDDDLSSILTYHVVPELVTSDDLAVGSFSTLNGEDISVTYYRPRRWRRNKRRIRTYIRSPTVDARLGRTDLFASNGVVHAITRVLIPP